MSVPDQDQTQVQSPAPACTDSAKLAEIAAALDHYEGPRTARGLPTVEGLAQVLGFALTAAERDQAIELSIAEADAIPPEPQAAPDSRRLVLYTLSSLDEAAIAEQRREAGVFVGPGEFAAGAAYPAKIVSRDGDRATVRVILDGREGLGTITVEDAPPGDGPGTWAEAG